MEHRGGRQRAAVLKGEEAGRSGFIRGFDSTRRRGSLRHAGTCIPGSLTPGIETLRAFVEHRMELSLVEEDALRESIELSGGLFQQLRRLIYNACHTAVGRKAQRLSRADVQDAASELRAELERPLTREHIAILHEVHATKQASAEGAALDLLHHLRLMEYCNGERWCDVNPLLLPTLKRWKPEAAT